MGLVAIKYLISEWYDLFLVTDVIDVCQKGLYILVDMARDRWIYLMIEMDRGLCISSYQHFKEPYYFSVCRKQYSARPHQDFFLPCFHPGVHTNQYLWISTVRTGFS